MAETGPDFAAGKASPPSADADHRKLNRGRHLLSYIEYVRRAVVLGLTVMALVAIAGTGALAAAGFAAAALAAYVLIPRAPRPAGAQGYSRFAAVIGPDIVGLLLTGVFIALPFWLRAGDASASQDFGVVVHPAALLTWPLALISAAILAMSARTASFWIIVDDDSVHVGSIRGEHHLRIAEIERVEPYRRGLPRWLRWLVPLLVLSGRYTAAGAVMLARDSIGLTLVGKDGRRIDIATDALEGPASRLLNLLRHGQVPVQGAGARQSGRRGRRKRFEQRR